MAELGRKKYLLKNTVIFSIGNFGSKFITFFLVPLYTNVLATDEFGIIDTIYTILTLVVPILTLNIGEAVTRFSLDKNSNQNKIMSVGLASLIMAFVTSTALMPLISHFTEYALYIYLYMISFAASQMFLAYLRGKELLLRYSIGSIIQTLSVALFNILFLVVLKYGIQGYFIAYSLANFITAIYAFFAGNVFSTIRHFSFDKSLAKSMAKFSIVLIPNNFMWWIMNTSDRLMVTAISGADVNGIYAVAYKLPTILSVMASVFNQAWLYSAIHENESADRDEYNNKMYDGLVSFVILIAIALLSIMKLFLKFYVGNDYYTAWKYTPYLMIGFVFMTLGTFLSTSYTVNKDSMGFLISGTIGAVVNVVLNFILIPRFAASGAAIATCISYFSVFCFRAWNTKKYLKLNFLNKKHIVGYVLLFATAATMFVDNKVGQVILFAELVLALMIYRKYWWNVAMQVLKKIKR